VEFKASAIFEQVCEELRNIGEPVEVLEQTITEARKKTRRHWHWNEGGTTKLIKDLIISGFEKDIRQIFTSYYSSTWSSLSQLVHVSARWETPAITFNSGDQIDFIDPLARDDQRAAAAAGLTFTLLQEVQDAANKIFSK